MAKYVDTVADEVTEQFSLWARHRNIGATVTVTILVPLEDLLQIFSIFFHFLPQQRPENPVSMPSQIVAQENLGSTNASQFSTLRTIKKLIFNTNAFVIFASIENLFTLILYNDSR